MSHLYSYLGKFEDDYDKLTIHRVSEVQMFSLQVHQSE